MKAFYAARETRHKKTEAVVTVFVDRVIGLWAMLLFAGVMMVPNISLLFVHPQLRWLSLIILGMLAVGTVFIILAFRGGVTRGLSAECSAPSRPVPRTEEPREDRVTNGRRTWSSR